jgi:uncharacterized linocin/CFP29 family protein
MADSNTQLHWTDEQWNKVQQVVYEEARKARVAGNFLPLYGPLDPAATSASRQKLVEPSSPDEEGERIAAFTVSDSATVRLSTLQVKVYLRGAQVADPALNSALIAFRRAANVLARLEDEIIFNGQEGENQGPRQAQRGGVRGLQERALWEVRGGQATDGLLPPVNRPGRRRADAAAGEELDLGNLGEELIGVISEAIGSLEASYQLGPFACVLDQIYFRAVQTPNGSLVLPQDRILPFLGGGALVRSSCLRPQTGLVIALGGEPIDLVVATDISVGFLQVTEHPFYVFRVYEKIVLRIKQPQAIQYIAAYPPEGLN